LPVEVAGKASSTMISDGRLYEASMHSAAFHGGLIAGAINVLFWN